MSWTEHIIGVFAVSVCAMFSLAPPPMAEPEQMPIPKAIIATAEITEATAELEAEPAITTAIIRNTTPEETSTLLLLPDVDTSTKLFTDYRWYGIDGTPHNRLQAACYTDEYGFRRFGEDYVVALGSFYSTDIGDRFRVKLENGFEFTVIMGDGKHDADCDELNMYTPCINYDGEAVGNMLEFIVDEDVLPSEIYDYGSLNYYDFMKGSVVEFEYLGRDESGDWTSYF